MRKGGRSSPPPTRYEAASHTDGAFPASAACSGAASLGYSSERFADPSRPPSRTPGPGAYRVARKMGAAGKGLPRATEERALKWQQYDTPGAGAYEPRRPASARTPSAAFSSRTARGHVRKSTVPGPGAYGGPTTDDASSSKRQIRRSASFGSSARRFKDEATGRPGPGAYALPLRTAKGAKAEVGASAAGVSAAFLSSSPRTELPFDAAAAATPGPGAHTRAGAVGEVAHGAHRSAAFASSSPRFKREKSTSPPPGTYNPDHRHSTTQRYSLGREVPQAAC